MLDSKYISFIGKREPPLTALYTGSTGAPKGVVVTHRNLVNVVSSYLFQLDLNFKGKEILGGRFPAIFFAFPAIFLCELPGHHLFKKIKFSTFNHFSEG
jgi:long-subunit acyl-CoA synthetase (AMP-forming)